jgi:hypothetical protein
MRSFSLVFGLGHLALGLWLLLAPMGFYLTVPGVSETGPFNPHFLRDVGCAFLVVGGGFAWFALDVRARAAAVAAASFLALHALVHVADGLAGAKAPGTSFLIFPSWAGSPRQGFGSPCGGPPKLEGVLLC